MAFTQAEKTAEGNNNPLDLPDFLSIMTWSTEPILSPAVE